MSSRFDAKIKSLSLEELFCYEGQGGENKRLEVDLLLALKAMERNAPRAMLSFRSIEQVKVAFPANLLEHFDSLE